MSIAPNPDSLDNANQRRMNCVMNSDELKKQGRFVRIYGDVYQCIENSHELDPFFVTLVSSSNHWMFLSSNGGISAGRRNAELAMFPYYAADQIVDQAFCTGATTFLGICREAHAGAESELWAPFSPTERTGTQKIYINQSLSSVIFEETNESNGLTFRYRWEASEEFGFVRSCELINDTSEKLTIRLLDGLQNLLPPGLPAAFQRRFSNLGDAYKRSELLNVESDTVQSLGIFYLNSIPTDNVEPSEGLFATTVFHLGLPTETTLLSSRQLQQFREHGPLDDETETRGLRQAYLVESNFQLNPGDHQQWKMVADIGVDQSAIIALKKQLEANVGLEAQIESSVIEQREQLDRIIASGDGLQVGHDWLHTARHRSNTTFNLMRGGVPFSGYRYPTEDFLDHLRRVSPTLVKSFGSQLRQLGDEPLLAELRQLADSSGNTDFRRIALEYLPLTFSRRHGDPTRPWNEFNIPSRSIDGSPKLQYEGNWRDIFQNWEALGISYPDLLPSMILRFVNASTADGYNPYRLTKTGFDWEKPDPGDPWANIGYWGDHQIVYLLRLIELGQKSNPSFMFSALQDRTCVFANVPYRIASYQDILSSPEDTIRFDDALSRYLVDASAKQGEAAKLLQLNGEPLRCTLYEKLLITSLTKFGNLVPDAGIWLNTQRPEWNDANNALVGNGSSVVTLFYLARFFQQLSTWTTSESYEIASPIARFLEQLHESIKLHDFSKLSDAKRKEVVDALQSASEQYRETVYEDSSRNEFRDLAQVKGSKLRSFCHDALDVLRQSIKSNLRPDALYQSYNLIDIGEDSISIDRLDVMLEGQVAALASGLLSIEDSLSLLTNLRKSELYRADVHSYLLYPDKELPTFLEKNILPDAWLNNDVVSSLVDAGDDSILQRDSDGNIRFNGHFRNIADLNTAIESFDSKSESLNQLVADHSSFIREIYEATFEHRRFTGRSGTFFAYEGLGSVYWHMVSKLVLATFETWQRAHSANHPRAAEIQEFYRDLKRGLGVHRSPQEYGAFPTIPYSHTPKHAGAQQPGMTGQVKEDIISRFAELGIVVLEGQVHFQTDSFDRNEMSDDPFEFKYYDVKNQLRSISRKSGFAYTYCQTPVLYDLSDAEQLRLVFADGTERSSDKLALTPEESASLFSRAGNIDRIEISIVR